MQHHWHLGSANPLLFWGCGVCPVHCRMLRSFSDFHPVDARSIPHSAVTTKNTSRHGQVSPEVVGVGGPLSVENYWLQKIQRHCPGFCSLALHG